MRLVWAVTPEWLPGQLKQEPGLESRVRDLLLIYLRASGLRARWYSRSGSSHQCCSQFGVLLPSEGLVKYFDKLRNLDWCDFCFDRFALSLHLQYGAMRPCKQLTICGHAAGIMRAVAK